MKSLRIFGGNHLSGDVVINGAKNSALPIIAASLLCHESKIENIPRITDVDKMINIINDIGCETNFTDDILMVNSIELKKNNLTSSQVSDFRGSYYLMGALINRFTSVVIAYPGGCDLGSRPIDFHLEGLKSLGVKVKEENGRIILTKNVIKGTTINLPKPSVGATINLILASVKCKGETIVNNVAKEPEVIDVVKYLNNMGAKITWDSPRSIKVVGVKTLNNVSYKIKPDRIEAGTYAALGAMFGKLTLKKVNVFDMERTLDVLEHIGCEVSYLNDILKIRRLHLKPIDLVSDVYPEFPTDLQQPFTTLLTMIGSSTVKDNIFKDRFSNCIDLKKMDAKILLKDDKIHISKSSLKGATVKAKDLRGGMSLVLAGLIADGITIVENIEIIERGYPDFVNKLIKLGAKLEIIE
ncbi:UDP-N-acetylglucosamine 1-carboxyvinyltransferase [Mycoplasmatota bacterium WC44]